MTGETVTRLRATTTGDRYGDDVADWSEPDELEIDGCKVAPRESDEDHSSGRQAVIQGLTIYTPDGADVLPSDRLRVRGVVHEVVGEPGVWTNPWSGVTAGLELRTRRVAG